MDQNVLQCIYTATHTHTFNYSITLHFSLCLLTFLKCCKDLSTSPHINTKCDVTETENI